MNITLNHYQLRLSVRDRFEYVIGNKPTNEYVCQQLTQHNHMISFLSFHFIEVSRCCSTQ